MTSANVCFHSPTSTTSSTPSPTPIIYQHHNEHGNDALITTGASTPTINTLPLATAHLASLSSSSLKQYSKNQSLLANSKVNYKLANFRSGSAIHDMGASSDQMYYF